MTKSKQIFDQASIYRYLLFQNERDFEKKQKALNDKLQKTSDNPKSYSRVERSLADLDRKFMEKRSNLLEDYDKGVEQKPIRLMTSTIDKIPDKVKAEIILKDLATKEKEPTIKKPRASKVSELKDENKSDLKQIVTTTSQPPGTDKIVELNTSNQGRIQNFAVRFYNPNGVVGLYQKIEPLFMDALNRGLANVTVYFKDGEGNNRFATITHSHLYYMEDFIERIQHIISDNVVGSDGTNQHEDYELLSDMFEITTINIEVKGGNFKYFILPTIDLKKTEGFNYLEDKCLINCLRYLKIIGPDVTTITLEDHEKYNKAKDEGVSFKYIMEHQKEFVKHVELTTNLEIIGLIYESITRHGTKIYSNSPFVKQKAIKYLKYELDSQDEKSSRIRQVIKKGGCKYYRMQYKDLLFREITERKLTDFDTFMAGKNKILFGPSGDNKDYHVEIVENSIDRNALSNVYCSGDKFLVLNKEGKDEIEAYSPFSVIQQMKEVISPPSRMTVDVVQDLETVIDLNDGAIIKVYAAAYCACPHQYSEYISLLCTPKFKNNLENLKKFKRQEIPRFVDVINAKNIDEYYRVLKDEEVDIPTGLLDMTPDGPGPELLKHLDKEGNKRIPRNICVSNEGNPCVVLNFKVTDKPSNVWTPAKTNAMDIYYDDFFASYVATDTKYNFITFNGSNFDHLMIFNYFDSLKTIYDNIGIKNPIFARGLLSFSITEKLGFEHRYYDLAKHIPGKLSSICKSWNIQELSKLELDHYAVQKAYNKGNEEFKAYLDENYEALSLYNAIDCMAPLAITQKYHNVLRSIPAVEDMLNVTGKGLFEILTIGSLAHKITLNTCKKNNIEFKPACLEIFNDLRKAAIGGRCSLYKNTILHIIGAIASMDTKSMYPYQMAVAPNYFGYGALYFANYDEYMSIPEKEQSKLDHDDGRPIGFFYGILNWEHLNVSPVKAAKMEDGSNDWEAKQVLGFHGTPEISFVLSIGGKFEPLPIPNVDRYQESHKMSKFDKIYKLNPLDLPHDKIHGLLYTKKCLGSEIFESILDFMKIKNEQDILKTAGDPEYNSSLRETSKLVSNSSSGKPFEALHFDKIQFVKHHEFDTLRKKETEGKITGLSVDKIHDSGIIVHYNLDPMDIVKTQAPFQLSMFIYMYSRIYLYKYGYDMLPEFIDGSGRQRQENVIYTDTDSIKVRNHYYEPVGCNPTEYLLNKLKNEPLHYCPKALEYDPRLATANLMSENIYGVFENEISDKLVQLDSFFLAKKNLIIRMKDSKDNVMKFKGVRKNDVLIPQSMIYDEMVDLSLPEYKDAEDYTKRLRIVTGLKKTKNGNVTKVYFWNTNTSLYDIIKFREERKDYTVERCLDNVVEYLQNKQPILILAMPFIKKYKGVKKEVSLEDTNNHQKNNICIISQPILKHIRLG